MTHIQLQKRYDFETSEAVMHTAKHSLVASCSWCGRWRDHKGLWGKPTVRQQALTSHTVCPTCFDGAIPQMIHELCEGEC